MESNFPLKNTLFSFLFNYQKIKKFTDLKVKVGNKEMDVHRMILEEASPVIKTMLQPRWFNGDSLEFKEENIDPEILEDLLSVLYRIPIEITTQNAYSLCIASHFLHIPNLLRKSEFFLCGQISFENVLNFYNLSQNLGLRYLRRNIGRFLINKNKNIPKNHEILSLKFDEIKQIFREIIDLIFTHINQEKIFHFIVLWAEYDFQSRKTLFSNFFEFFSIEKLSDALLMELALSHPLISKYFTSSQFFKNALKEISFVSQLFGNSRLYFLKRDRWNFSFSISYMNLMNGKRRAAFRTTIESIRYICGYAVIGNKIYFSESCFEFMDFKYRLGYCSFLKVFDCENLTLKTLCRMPIAGSWVCFRMTALNDLLFVSGGLSGSKFSHSNVFQYSPFTNTWTEMKKMIETRHEHSLITLNGLIYAIGGFERGDNVKTMECYNPATNEWKYVTPFGLCRLPMISTSHHNKIYVLGRDNFKMFNPEFNTWQDLPLPSDERRGKLVSINDKLLHIISQQPKNISEFNTNNNSWLTLLDFEDKYCYDDHLGEPVVVNFSE